MIRLVTRENQHHYRNEMDQAFRLQHRFLAGNKRSRRPVPLLRRETDRFDNIHAVHMLYINRNKVRGYQRIVPTTRPNLLSEVSPELCEVSPPVGAHVWELSRQCVQPNYRAPGSCKIATALWAGLVEWGLECGISNFITEIEPDCLIPLVSLHFKPISLGLPQKIGGQEMLAVILSFDERTLNRIHEIRAEKKKVLVGNSHHPDPLYA